MYNYIILHLWTLNIFSNYIFNFNFSFVTGEFYATFYCVGFGEYFRLEKQQRWNSCPEKLSASWGLNLGLLKPPALHCTHIEGSWNPRTSLYYHIEVFKGGSPGQSLRDFSVCVNCSVLKVLELIEFRRGDPYLTDCLLYRNFVRFGHL